MNKTIEETRLFYILAYFNISTDIEKRFDPAVSSLFSFLRLSDFSFSSDTEQWESSCFLCVLTISKIIMCLEKSETLQNSG